MSEEKPQPPYDTMTPEEAIEYINVTYQGIMDSIAAGRRDAEEARETLGSMTPEQLRARLNQALDLLQEMFDVIEKAYSHARVIFLVYRATVRERPRLELTHSEGDLDYYETTEEGILRILGLDPDKYESPFIAHVYSSEEGKRGNPYAEVKVRRRT